MSIQIACPICLSGDKKTIRLYGQMVHPNPLGPRYAHLARIKKEGETTPFDDIGQICPDWDNEYRHVSEPLGSFEFAWWPRTCRNGERRWLKLVERHLDGTFTLGNRG